MVLSFLMQGQRLYQPSLVRRLKCSRRPRPRPFRSAFAGSIPRIAGLQKKIAACRDSSSEAREIIGQLQEDAGVTSIEDLRTAIRRSDELRMLQADFDQLTNTLAKDGELATQEGARLAITGALALIVGGSGASGTAAFSGGLAFWYGKDAFKTWMNNWGKRATPRKRAKKKS
ncbi:hypothetical protein CQ10_38315 [Bradyrhizobium valentinum]|nr:hypothetical protein CQ10_38315 [Bradyrhizobium valentinum]